MFLVKVTVFKILKSVTLTGTYELPEDDQNVDRNIMERF